MNKHYKEISNILKRNNILLYEDILKLNKRKGYGLDCLFLSSEYSWVRDIFYLIDEIYKEVLNDSEKKILYKNHVGYYNLEKAYNSFNDQVNYVNIFQSKTIFLTNQFRLFEDSNITGISVEFFTLFFKLKNYLENGLTYVLPRRMSTYEEEFGTVGYSRNSIRYLNQEPLETSSIYNLNKIKKDIKLFKSEIFIMLPSISNLLDEKQVIFTLKSNKDDLNRFKKLCNRLITKQIKEYLEEFDEIVQELNKKYSSTDKSLKYTLVDASFIFPNENVNILISNKECLKESSFFYFKDTLKMEEIKENNFSELIRKSISFDERFLKK